MAEGTEAMTLGWLVAVGAGRWQLAGICAAKELGLSVLAVDGDPNAPGFAMADRSLVADIRDPEGVCQGVRTTNIVPAGAIAIANEAGMLAAARLRQEFHLPGADVLVTQRLTNKALQRQAWDKAGCPNPTWQLVPANSDLAALRAPMPAIAKPVDSAGSRGIRVVHNHGDLPDAVMHARQGSNTGEAIVEAYITGTEYTVETFAHDGEIFVLAITSKQKVPNTNNTVAMELQTACDPPDVLNDLGETACKALRALGYTDGPGHTELLRQEDGRIFLVETAGRGGGFGLFESFVPQVSGYDIVKACTLQAVGHPVPLPDKSLSQTHGILRFLPSVPGTVEKILGLKAANDIPGVLVQALVTEGQSVGSAQSDGDRMALIVATGENPGQARQRAQHAEELVSIVMKKDAQCM